MKTAMYGHEGVFSAMQGERKRSGTLAGFQADSVGSPLGNRGIAGLSDSMRLVKRLGESFGLTGPHHVSAVESGSVGAPHR
jgi:hypothetical protein